MKYELDNRVVLSSERENKSLYPWSIKEFNNGGQQIVRDQVPWDWSLYFEVAELIPTCRIQSRRAADDQAGSFDLSEFLCGKLKPCVRSREAGHYSMFGTQRTINEFDIFIYKADDDKDRCHLWGSTSFASDIDFEDVLTPDCVGVYVHLSAQKFDQLMKFVKFPRPTSAEIRLTGVDGFYSEWSPSIRTDSIKVLANASDQGLENPEGLTLKPPVLGNVREFDFTLRQKYPFPS
jgi:hypothetical protein